MTTTGENNYSEEAGELKVFFSFNLINGWNLAKKLLHKREKKE